MDVTILVEACICDFLNKKLQLPLRRLYSNSIYSYINIAIANYLLLYFIIVLEKKMFIILF